jgi:hypothetical protein
MFAAPSNLQNPSATMNARSDFQQNMNEYQDVYESQQSQPIPVYLLPTREEVVNSEQTYQEYQGPQPTWEQGHWIPPNRGPQSSRTTGPNHALPVTRGPPVDSISLRWYPAPHASNVHHITSILQIEAHVNAINWNPVQLSAVVQAGNAVVPYGLPQMQTVREQRVNVVLRPDMRFAQPSSEPPRRCPMCLLFIPCQHIPY